MRRCLPILCLLLAACDREERGNYEASRSSNSSSRTQAPPPSETQRRNEEIMAAAMKDPELRRLQKNFDLDLLARQEDSLHSVETAALASRYALHHREAGRIWLGSIPRIGGTEPMPLLPHAWSDYASALLKISSDDAFNELEQFSGKVDQWFYTEGLFLRVRGADVERMWNLLDSPEGRERDVAQFKRPFVSSIAYYDPDKSWQMWQQHFTEDANAEIFLSEVTDISEDTPYPAYLFDLIPDMADRVAAVVNGIEDHSLSATTLAPIESWLKAQPPSAALDVVYAEMAIWYTDLVEDDAARSAHWLEQISDPEIRAKAEKRLKPGRLKK